MDKSKKYLIFALITSVFIFGLTSVIYNINSYISKQNSNLTASVSTQKKELFCDEEKYDSTKKECCEYRNVLPEYFSGIYLIKNNLSVGSSGSDVAELQAFLVSKGFLVMPAGVSTGYFGALTQAALAKYQAANGIAPASGKFDSLTKNKISEERIKNFYSRYEILDIGQCKIGGGKISYNSSNSRKTDSNGGDFTNLFKYHCPKKFSITLTGEECEKILGDMQGGSLDCKDPDNPLMNPPNLLPGHIGLGICLDSKDYIREGKCFIPPWTANNPFVFYGNPDVDEGGQITGCGFYVGIGGGW